MSRWSASIRASSMTRFLRRGFAGLERRVARLLSPVPATDPLTTRIIEASFLPRLVHAAATQVVLAGQRSLSVRMVRATLVPWREASAPRRTVLAGIALIAAVASHLVLVPFGDRPTGFYWLILPFVATAAGVALVAMRPTTAGHQ
ncbi:MAG: hypothetical protein ABI665_07815 [Vicinamibacterales bacterium]